MARDERSDGTTMRPPIRRIEKPSENRNAFDLMRSEISRLVTSATTFQGFMPLPL